MEQNTTAYTAPAPDLLTASKSICDHWDVVMTRNEVPEQHQALRSAITHYEKAPVAGSEAEKNLFGIAKSICDYWNEVVPADCVNAQHLALRAAIKHYETKPVSVAGLGRVTNEDEGVLTLQFKDEDAAQAFMQRVECTVDVDQMPPSRDTISTAPLAALSDDQLDELHERLEAKVRAAVKAAPAGGPSGARVERRMYLRELLADLR